MAYSMGFSPHPKVSWVGASPTGVASEAEYVEIQVVEVVDPERLRVALDEALPPGLDVMEVVVAGPGALADRIEASRWRIELPGVDVGELTAAATALLRADRIEVERLMKDGRRTIDARAAIVTADVSASADLPAAADPGAADVAEAGSDAPSRVTQDTESATESVEFGTNPAAPVAAHGGPPVWHGRDLSERSTPYGILELVVRQTSPAVRPDDMLSALRVVAGLVPPVPAKATRMAQGKLDDAGRLVDPLAADQVANRTA